MILLSHWRQTACQFIGEAKLCNLAGKCIAPEPKALGRLNAASAGRAHGRADERAPREDEKVFAAPALVLKHRAQD